MWMRWRTVRLEEGASSSRLVRPFVLLATPLTEPSPGPFSWKNFVDLADHKQTVPASKGKKMFCDKDAREVLGMKYHSMEETTKDTLVEFKARGWYES